MSSNDDFNGPPFRPARGRGADDYSGEARGGKGAPGGGKYPAPKGWDSDGFWSDPAIDSDYQTGLTGAVRPDGDGPRDEPGYSFWKDGKGWESSPGKSAAAGDATSLDATRASFGGGGPGDATRMDYGRGAGGPGGEPTAFYGPGGGPGGVYRSPGGPGGPGGPGWGPGGRGPGRRGPGGPGGRRGKRKGNWWRHWSWQKAVAVTGGVFVLFMLVLVSAYYYVYNSTKIPAALASVNYQNTVVYYANGKTPIGTIGPVNRHDLTFSQIPKQLQNAFIAAEDRNFWNEGGISPTGILRAAYYDLTSSGGNLNGGSTITQEFVRNYYDNVGLQQTISRKIKEVIIAQKLAGLKSKQWILTNYLNVLFLGDNSYGVAAAAHTYFGKPVAKLSIAQDAVLAAFPQQPSYYPLLKYRSGLMSRWKYVLTQMVRDNYITQAQMNSMKFPELLTYSEATPGATTTGYSANSKDPWAPYIMNVVYNELTNPQGDHVSQHELEYGGLKVVTTISRPMEKEMYKAVNQNIAAIKSSGGTLPPYVMIGAELQNPKTGAIIAMYPGRGQNMPPKKCKRYDCDLNTAVYAREQVGSSFKPYVLSTAVAEGMNVKNSILNANPYLCVPPDSMPMVLSKETKSLLPVGHCPQSNWFPVENDGGEIIGSPKLGGGTNVQNAFAQSSNTAFTDLAHRATTSAIIKMAQNYGVDIAPLAQGGSNLSNMVGDVNLALGTASLTVNEQATMLSTIDDNGLYHSAHIVKYWQQPNGPEQRTTVDSHRVLTVAQDSQVQYAMDMTTVDGTGVGAAVGLGNRPIIAKTGTTTNYHSGFFIGAIPQYSLVVGIFTQQQSASSAQSLIPLGGGGYGGVWPAKIWNTFALAKFANLPVQNFLPPQFSGQKWVQVKPPKKHKKHKKHGKCTSKFRGRRSRVSNCPSPTPNPTQTPPGRRHGHGHGGGTPTPTPSSTPSGLPTIPGPTPTPTVTVSPSVTPSGSASGTAGGTSSPSASATSTLGGALGAGQTTSGVQAGLAAGGVLMVLPGTLLWTSVSRRRRRRRGRTAR